MSSSSSSSPLHHQHDDNDNNNNNNVSNVSPTAAAMFPSQQQIQQQQQQQQQHNSAPTTYIGGMENLTNNQYNSGQSNNTNNNNNHNHKTLNAQKSMEEEEMSFYSSSSQNDDIGDDNIWGLLTGVGGNIYEWYDFAVYGLLAPEIGSAFFPSSSAELQLINSFGVYLAAFLMRPLGAIFFGEIGDRIIGRKYALLLSILLITIPSILMGCLPTYDMWGIAAPILLILFRMFQGLSVGGQLAGSYVMSIEQSTSKSRGVRGAICDASSTAGILLASFVTTITRKILTEEQVDNWGWRCPFLFSLILAPILYHVVDNTQESKHWEDNAKQQQKDNNNKENSTEDNIAIHSNSNNDNNNNNVEQHQGISSSATAISNLDMDDKSYAALSEMHEDPTDQINNNKDGDENEQQTTTPAIVDLFSSPFRRRQLAGMVQVVGTVSGTFYLLFLWSPVYLSHLRGLLSDGDADLINFISIGTYVVLIVVFGKISDMLVHRMDLMKIGLLAVIVSSPVMFGMFETTESFWGILIGQLQLCFVLAMVEGPKAAWEVELWMNDPTISYTAVAIGHNLAATIFGGTMPLIATFLYYRGYNIIENSIQVTNWYGNHEDIWWPYLFPSIYTSILAMLAIISLNYLIRHPHDIRSGDHINQKQLKSLEIEENKRLKKKKQRNQFIQEEQNNIIRIQQQQQQHQQSGNIDDDQFEDEPIMIIQQDYHQYEENVVTTNTNSNSNHNNNNNNLSYIPPPPTV